MSVEAHADLVFVHFENGSRSAGYHLFDLHVRKVLPGYPIPVPYTVHSVDSDPDNGSINLVMTNGGRHVDAMGFQEFLDDLKIFGSLRVGIYGDKDIAAA